MSLQIPDYINPDIWSEWINYRREDKKKPASERSQRMTLRKLERLTAEGYDANRLIEHAIEHEWQGIYAIEECRLGSNRQGRQAGKLSAVERVRAANAFRIVGENDGDLRHTLDEPARGSANGHVVPWTRGHERG